MVCPLFFCSNLRGGDMTSELIFETIVTSSECAVNFKKNPGLP